MTDDDIRTAIAEACGWILHDESIVTPSGEVIDCEFLCEDAVDASWPNYPNDLNAMHEAEKALSEEHHSLYVDCLLCLIHEVDQGYFDRIEWNDSFAIVHATARQRAEAFLRTIGKWNE